MKVQMQLTKDKEFFKVYVNSEEEELERLFFEFVSQMLAYKRNENKRKQGDIEK
ncbi:TPA: hypothetical protein KOD20_003928 [Clostridioides difficile]|uniref:hypothetical protein n=1 Tax=Clostridioides difficile TaxID=1496 RepID=UPI0009800BAE|nr:hypothetical protein [Clostridioides difficile]EKS6837352.1 hypothetical protein [Clostridioides difficile]MCE4900486.1 hypothetical protein [Clostridioides difficile]MDN9807805.1 hypothetical protein [Clostridioides difficile]PCD16795.1 hypothetical protein V440_04240 [Clostridioides difficile]SJO88577.1 Uncharacterised protein [Clostridioides difficile]